MYSKVKDHMLYSYLNQQVQQVQLVNKEKKRQEEEEDKEEQRAALAYWLFNMKEIKEYSIKSIHWMIIFMGI